MQNVKKELRSITASLQKGITMGETATTAAMEAAEIDKMAAGMARDNGINGTQHQAGAAMSHGAVAARGTLAQVHITYRTFTLLQPLYE